VDISDGICARLTGGLGNQLFVLAAAWEQSTRLDCPLYIDASKFLTKEIRSFALNNLELPGIVLGEESTWDGSDSHRHARRPFRFQKRQVIFTERSFGFDATINRIVPGTTIVGYFQSPKYFTHVAQKMQALLETHKPTSSEQTILDELRSSSYLSMHVRRGDYLDPKVREVHGMTAARYFVKARKFLSHEFPGMDALIFSDSVDYVREELRAEKGVRYFDRTDSLGEMSTLHAMAGGQGFVMSNSTFSWWGAWLMSMSKECSIIAPRPWFASGESTSDLLAPDWLTLDGR